MSGPILRLDACVSSNVVPLYVDENNFSSHNAGDARV